MSMESLKVLLGMKICVPKYTKESHFTLSSIYSNQGGDYNKEMSHNFVDFVRALAVDHASEDGCLLRVYEDQVKQIMLIQFLQGFKSRRNKSYAQTISEGQA